MIQQNGKQLMKELVENNGLMKFNEIAFLNVGEEVNEKFNDIVSFLRDKGTEAAEDPLYHRYLVLWNGIIFRQKRYALAYLMERLSRIVAHRLESSVLLPAEVSDKLHSQERLFASQVCELMHDYAMDVHTF